MAGQAGTSGAGSAGVTLKGNGVFFVCQRCKQDLECPFNEAGTEQVCPFCSTKFIVPGKAEVERTLMARARAKREAEEARAKRDAEKTRARDAATAAAAALQATAPPPPLDYQQQPPAPAPAPTPQMIPDYTGLKNAAFVLGLLAVLYYILGAIGIVGGLVVLVSNPRSVGGVAAAMPMIAAGIGGLMFGAIMHGLSEAAKAMRDIARNSFLQLMKG